MAYIHICICSAQSKNLYNSRIVLRRVGILTLLRNVGKSYLAQYNSLIAPAQSKNRDKVEISFLFLLLYKVGIGTNLKYHRMQTFSSHSLY